MNKDRKCRIKREVFDPSLPPSAYTMTDIDYLVSKSKLDTEDLNVAIAKVVEEGKRRKRIDVAKIKKLKYDLLMLLYGPEEDEPSPSANTEEATVV